MTSSASQEATFPALLSELHAMLYFVRNIGEQHGILKDKLLRLELACEELLVNIISYAYPHQPGEITISCKGNTEALLITITDCGLPFNPLTIPPIRKDLPLEQRTLGGLGIFLAKASVDHLHYERVQDRNTVHLTVYTHS